MKNHIVSLVIVSLFVISAPALAENWVQSGEIKVDLDEVQKAATVNNRSGGEASGEILINPGFEAGELSPWYTSAWTVSMDNPHSGDYCATDEGNYWIRQDFAEVDTEDVLSITLWTRQPEESIQAVDLMYKDGTYFEDLIWPSESWGQFDVTSWLAPGKVLVGIRVWGYSGGGPDPDLSFIDDVSVITKGPQFLKVDPDEISAWFGGTATFMLNGGPDLAGRGYGLFGSVSGTTPGTALPGGMILPINFDWFTGMLLLLELNGNPLVNDFIGVLDVDGYAEASLTLPGHCQLFDDILSNFAWCTYGPFDFVSNPVDLEILGVPPVPPSYAYDDGTSENALGWTAGGESVWAHSFDSGIGDTLTTVSTTFGSSTATNGPANGDPCWVYVWDDPNNDGDPVDGALIGTANGVVANTNTNTFNEYVLDAPTAVTGKFFVAAHVYQAVGIYAAPMDESTPYGGEAWFMGGATFDPNDLSTTAIYEMGSIGFPAYWLLRADND